MSNSNVETVRRFYATRDPAILDENIDWKLADGFPTGGRYRGRKAVFEDWWPRQDSHFGEWQANPESLLDAGEAVVALGRYQGVAKTTGRSIEVPFVHVWRMRDDRIVALEQHTDTLLIHRALAPED
jgi:ketosteroid isomerase-like protein